MAVPTLEGHVHFNHIGLSYGDRPAIQDFCLKVAPGEIVAIVGPSGSGKSTIMSLLTRFYDPCSGRILIDGVDLQRLSAASWHRPAGQLLFSGTVEENIRYGRPKATMEEVHRAARLGPARWNSSKRCRTASAAKSARAVSLCLEASDSESSSRVAS